MEIKIQNEEAKDVEQVRVILRSTFPSDAGGVTGLVQYSSEFAMFSV